MRIQFRVHTCLALALGACLVTSTTLLANQQQLATSIKETRGEAGRTHDQLGSTLSALNALTKQTKGDLRPAYNAFATEVPKTRQAADWTRTRVNWMQVDGQKYFNGWQKEVDGISNASLRKKAQKRLESVKKNYDKLATSLTNAADKFEPFLSDLNDIQKTLANDVTPGGVKAVRGTVSSANWNYKFVNRSIDDALKTMEKMEKSLSSEVK